MTDSREDLLERVGQGDRAAFRLLYDATSGVLFSVCLAVLRNRPRAEDVLQEAYVRIWERAASFDRSKGGATTWMAVVTRRLAINELRRSTPVERGLDEDISVIENLADELSEGDPIGRGRLAPCLKKLGEMQRESVILSYVYGYTNEELARRFNRPLGTVKSWLFRSLIDLRKCME